jgi:signal transduction histidine kinase
MNSDKYPQENMLNVLSRLNEIASAVMRAAEAQNVEQVLERIAHVSKELVGAKYAALGVPDEQGGLRYFKVAGLTAVEIAKMGHLPFGHGMIGAIMEERQTVRLERMADDARSVGFCEGHPMMTSLLGSPIQVGDQLFGMLYLCDRVDGLPFSEQDQWLVETIAGYAALAIAGWELHESQNRLTLLEERQRISMELHDGVIQSLYAVGMHLDLLRSNTDFKAAELGIIIGELNTIIDDIRVYIMNLKRDNHQQKTILDNLRAVISRLFIPASIQIDLEAPDSLPLFSETTFEAIMQILNEALSNAVRHSEAHHIKITAMQNENSLLIVVKDDGRGFNLQEIQKRDGLGLKNIQQRTHMHGGQIYIDTSPGQGTRLTITVPVK